jgi:hypothetical protein
MPLHGDVRTFSLPAIVRMIHAETKTGVLKITGDGRRSHIYFKSGKIIYTSGHRAQDLRLGSLLKANNLITEEKLQEMLKIAKVVEKPLGRILLERGYVSKENLVRILSYQVKEAVSELLTWDDAEFVYTEGLAGYVEDIQFEVDPIRLVNEAEHWGKYRRIIPNDDVVFLIRPGALRSKSVYSGAGLRVLLLIDGKRTVSQIIAETGYSRLAVYRALATLAAADAITRPVEARQKTEADPLPTANIVVFYLRLLRAVTADLGAEVGARRATTSLEASLRHLKAREEVLLALRPDQDSTEGLRRIQTALQREGISGKDLLKGLNQAMLALLGEENRILGPKATMGTVRFLTQSLQDAPKHEQILAKAMTRFLAQYESKLSVGAPPPTSLAEVGGTETVGALKGTLEVNLEAVGGSAIVNFFNAMIQVVTSDLEKVLGAKARDIFQGILKSSKYYENFLSQFSAQSNGSANVVRIREYLKTRELKLSKQELVQAFQEVLVTLLREQERLLGTKATQQTTARLREAMTRSELKHKPLTDHLSGLLATRGVGPS